MALGSLEHRLLRRHLSAYADGALAPPLRRRVEGHLSRCPSCRRDLAELEATVRALAALPQEAAPRSFALTRERLAQPSPAPPPLAMRAFPALATACVLALASLLALDAFLPAAAPSPAPEQAAPALSEGRPLPVEPSPAPRGLPTAPEPSPQLRPEATPPAPGRPPAAEAEEEGGADALRLAQVALGAGAMAALGAWGVLWLQRRRG